MCSMLTYLRVRYDTTVRNARGCVMQFLYGEDGMDAQRIEKQFFDTYKYKIADFREVRVSTADYNFPPYIHSNERTHSGFKGLLF